MNYRLYEYSAYRALFNIFFKLKGVQAPRSHFLLLGCYNSGTTIFKDILTMHDDFTTTPIEIDRLSCSISDLEDKRFPRCMYANIPNLKQDDQALDYERFMLDVNPWIAKDKYFLDKTISNIYRLDYWYQKNPDTKYIYISRNPKNVIKGIKQKSSPLKEGAKLLHGVYSDDLLLKQCEWFDRKIIDFKVTRDSNVLFISYEYLLDNPVLTLEKVFDFLGVSQPYLNYEKEVSVLQVNSKKVRLFNKVENIRPLCTECTEEFESYIKLRNDSEPGN